MTQDQRERSTEPMTEKQLEGEVGGRPSYFNGRFLSASDLAQEQTYLLKALDREKGLSAFEPAWPRLNS